MKFNIGNDTIIHRKSLIKTSPGSKRTQSVSLLCCVKRVCPNLVGPTGSKLIYSLFPLQSGVIVGVHLFEHWNASSKMLTVSRLHHVHSNSNNSEEETMLLSKTLEIKSFCAKMMGFKKNKYRLSVLTALCRPTFSYLCILPKKKKKVQLTDFMTVEYRRSFSASCSVSAEGGRSMTPTFCNTVLEVK